VIGLTGFLLTLCLDVETASWVSTPPPPPAIPTGAEASATEAAATEATADPLSSGGVRAPNSPAFSLLLLALLPLLPEVLLAPESSRIRFAHGVSLSSPPCKPSLSSSGSTSCFGALRGLQGRPTAPFQPILRVPTTHAPHHTPSMTIHAPDSVKVTSTLPIAPQSQTRYGMVCVHGGG
jgi:hypothetical protein